MYSLFVTLDSPFHHGAGSSGNTALLRTQEVAVWGPGENCYMARVPFLSASSVRHELRNALAWLTIKTLEIEDGTLAKPVVDLLFSGGSVSRTGAEVNLEHYREVEECIPWLAMMGYAAGSTITSGTLRVSDLCLFCTENADRLPLDSDSLTLTIEGLKPAAFWRGEEFGTRVDGSTSPVARFIDTANEMTGTTQMIFSTQIVKPGAQFYGQAWLDVAATEAHENALAAALLLWAPERAGVYETQIGAKNAQGYGQARLIYLEEGKTPDSGAVEALAETLRSHKDRIIPLLEELTK
ncbi:hypothetical protein [Actinobaculum suis]|uniref:hypothetical protein n=1 Tax=Actinobaculum suis TaxID=1657 RepID=UPI00069F075D|nr:hypothetical protein [Actinobaculum suis]